MRADVTMAEIAALLAVATDHAFGQPPGSQLRAVVLGHELAEVAGLDDVEQSAVWWTTALRFLGCTGHTYEVSVAFGDDIGLRADSLLADSANPTEFLRLSIAHAGSGRSGFSRIQAVLSLLTGGKRGAELNFRTACEVADAFAIRLRLPDASREALAFNFERWNGKGLPLGVQGSAIPLPMRIAQVSQELEVLARIEGIEVALETIGNRRGSAYDPDLADLVLGHAGSWWTAVEQIDPWEAALSRAPACRPLDDTQRREALLVIADFADLKSPWTAGHSRGVAALASTASGAEAEPAALVHDLGCVAVPNSVWDKAGPLTRDERDRMETHALVTEQLLRRVPGLQSLGNTAGAAHDRLDGSGYHRRAKGAQLDDVQRVIAVADAYHGMTSDRPHRSALTPSTAVAELRSMAADGKLDGEAVERVIEAAGHRRAARPALPAGLTAREAEVLRLVTRGYTTRQIADELVISAKTTEHHVTHIYAKIGVSTRGAAALFAIEHGIFTTANSANHHLKG